MARAAVGSTTITTSPTGGAPTITSRSAVALRRLFFTKKDVEDPEKLWQLLSRFQDFVFQALRPLSQNPVLFGNPIIGVSFSSGQTQYLAHGLGRPYQGFIPIRAQGNPWSGQEVALPTGVTSSQMIAIKSGNTGTYSFLVW